MVDIESLSGSAYGDMLTGNDGANVISGGAGDDLLEGLNGDDTLNGGDGVDTVSYAHAGAGVAIDMADSGPQDTGGAGIDTLSRAGKHCRLVLRGYLVRLQRRQRA